MPIFLFNDFAECYINLTVGNWLSHSFQRKTSLNTSKQKHGWQNGAFSVRKKLAAFSGHAAIK